MAFELDRNADGDGLLFVYCEEVDVEAVILDGMELKFVKNYGVVGLAVEGEVHDVCVGSLEEALEIFLIYSEEDVFDAASIEVARNEALLAESLDDGFVANLTALAVKCEMFHFKKS